MLMLGREGCQGLGSKVIMDPDKIIPNPDLSVVQGAVVPWQGAIDRAEGDPEADGGWGWEQIVAMRDQWGLDLEKPWRKLPKKLRDTILRIPWLERASVDPRFGLGLG